MLLRILASTCGSQTSVRIRVGRQTWERLPNRESRYYITCWSSRMKLRKELACSDKQARHTGDIDTLSVLRATSFGLLRLDRYVHVERYVYRLQEKH